MMRRLWRPKKGPIFTSGRAKHLAWGAGIVWLGSVLWGYEGTAFALFAILVVGGLWEMLTAPISTFTGWKHPWGDGIDFLAFVLGAVAIAVPVFRVAAS